MFVDIIRRDYYLPPYYSTARLTIHGAMLRIVRAADGWWDDGWSDIVGLTLAVNLTRRGGTGYGVMGTQRHGPQSQYADLYASKMIMRPERETEEHLDPCLVQMDSRY